MKINNILVIIFILLIFLCIYYIKNYINNSNNYLYKNNTKNKFSNTNKFLAGVYFKTFKGRSNIAWGIYTNNINNINSISELNKRIYSFILNDSNETKQSKKYFFSSDNTDFDIILYKHANFKGSELKLFKNNSYSYNINLTEYKDNKDNTSWNDKVSSLDIAPFTKVTLYEHIDNIGRSVEHINNTTRILKINMNQMKLQNDILSSVKIESLLNRENIDNISINFERVYKNIFGPKNVIIQPNLILELNENNDYKYISGEINDVNSIEKLFTNYINFIDLSNNIIKQNNIILHIQKKNNETKKIKINKYIILPEGEYKFNKDQFIKILNKFDIPSSEYSIKKVEVNNNYTNNFEFLINSQIIIPKEENKETSIDININNPNFEIISRPISNRSINDNYVVLYENKNFGGNQKRFNIGSHNLRDTLKMNDYYSSIKLFGDVKVTLFEHINYEGKKLEVIDDIKDLGNYNFDNFLSSLNVKKTKISKYLYLVKQIKFSEYIKNPFKYVISQGLFKNYEAKNKKEILEDIYDNKTTTFDLNKENINFDDPLILNLFSNKSNFSQVNYKKYEFDFINIIINNNNIFNTINNTENKFELNIKTITNNINSNKNSFNTYRIQFNIKKNFKDNNDIVIWNKTNNLFEYLDIDIQNSNSNKNLKYENGIEYILLPKNIGIVEYLKESDGNIKNEFLKLQNINNIKTVNNNENYKIINYLDNKLISFRLVNSLSIFKTKKINNENKKFINYSQLCSDKCISKNLNNEKSGNLFTLKTGKETNIKYGFETEESKNIDNSSNFSVCQGYLDEEKNCLSVFDSKGQNKTDCRTCRMPIKHLNNNVDITCPDVCFNTESTDNLVINTDNKGNNVCTRYAVINERNNDTKKYNCSNSIPSDDKIYINCSKCTIKNMDDVDNSRMKMNESFTTTNTTEQIIGTINWGETTQSNYIYIENDDFTGSEKNYDPNLNANKQKKIHRINNISSDKLLGIYSNLSNENFPVEFQNKYPYTLFGISKPNIILGPGDNLQINGDNQVIINYNSRTAQNEQKPFNKDFTLTNGNISSIKMINEPQDCFNFTSSYSDCINKQDRNGNNCRFIYANQLNDDENTSNFLKNRTTVEEENNYNPLQQELLLYNTSDKNGNTNYEKVKNVYDAKRTRPNQNFCFSINPTESDVFPLNGACSTSNSLDKIKFPCVRINEKDSNGNITKTFVRHRNAMINELGIQIRKFVFNEPGAKMQNLRTLQRIFEVNDIIKSEVEAEDLIQKELLKSNQNRLNKIHNNLMNEINNNNLHNIEGFTTNNKKPIQRIQSNYTNQNLTVIPNKDNSFSMKINDNCLSVYNDNEYSEVKCNKNSQAQKFVQNKIMNASDEKILMGKTQIAENATYPYSIFKSKVSGNCLNMDEDGISMIPCNPNSERQKWAPFTDQNICLDSR